jgi:hypothetical protein
MQEDVKSLVERVREAMNPRSAFAYGDAALDSLTARIAELEGICDENDAREAALTAALERAEREIETLKILDRNERANRAEARAQKAEAVVEAARNDCFVVDWDVGEAYKSEALQVALTAYDEGSYGT